MTFQSVPALQRKFDRTAHRSHPHWRKRARGRAALAAAAIGVPVLAAACMCLAAPLNPLPLPLQALTGAGLPFLILAPAAILRAKNDRRSCTPESVGRYADSLLLTDDGFVYTYRNTRDGARVQYETSVPYALIERMVYVPGRDLLMILSGGVDSAGRPDGTTIRRMNYRTGAGYVNRFSRWMEIPMVYADNERLIRALESASGVQAERSEDPSLPA